jgi:ribosomal-protein-alanine N-acetyltransferase
MPERSLHLEPLTEADLDLVAETEKLAYAHPWTRGHFRDSLLAGYPAVLLTTPVLPGDAPRQQTASGRMLLGYWVAMRGVDEVHLLNLVVAPEHRRQGWGKVLMQALIAQATAQGAHSLWLEVRESNAPAQALYAHMGFRTVGRRKQYYPLARGQREDALLMSLDLTARPDTPTP